MPSELNKLPSVIENQKFNNNLLPIGHSNTVKEQPK